MVRTGTADRFMMTAVQINPRLPPVGKVMGADGMRRLCEDVSDVFVCQSSWTTGAVGDSAPNVSGFDVSRAFIQFASTSIEGGSSLDFLRSSESGLQRNLGEVVSDVRRTQFRSPGDLLVQSDGYTTQLGAPRSLALLSSYTGGCDMVCQNADAFRYATQGKGVRVYIVDQDVYGLHQEFEGGAGGTQRVSLTDRFYSPTAEMYKGQPCASWHGTHVAGLVAGLTYGSAKDAYIVPVAVQPGCDAGGYSSDLAAGLDWVLRHHELHPGPAIVSMSLLISDPSAASVIQLQVQDLQSSGIVVIAAAGNFAEDACTYAPANLQNVITVAATQLNNASGTEILEPWPSTNYGECVTIWAPGADVESASSNDSTSSLTLSGTSQAAPFVTGLAAQYLQRFPDATHADVHRHLSSTAAQDALRAHVLNTVPDFAQVDLSAFVHTLPLVTPPPQPPAYQPCPPPSLPPVYGRPCSHRMI